MLNDTSRNYQKAYYYTAYPSPTAGIVPSPLRYRSMSEEEITQRHLQRVEITDKMRAITTDTQLNYTIGCYILIGETIYRIDTMRTTTINPHGYVKRKRHFLSLVAAENPQIVQS